LVDQDLQLLSHVLEAGRALVIAINKWDGTDQDQKEAIKSELDRRLTFIDFAKIHFISALHGSGVGDLYKSIQQAYSSAMLKVSTSRLNKILERAVFNHQPPLVNGRRIKLRYAHLGGSNPPIIIIHGNQTEKIPKAYERYLTHQFVQALKLKGTPLRVEFRTSNNPFKGENKGPGPQDRGRKGSITGVRKKL
jgi:GTP-binding protein